LLAEAESARSESYGFANPLLLRACVYLALPASGHRSRRVMRTHDQATKQPSFTDRLARILCARATFRGESLEEVARYLSVHPTSVLIARMNRIIERLHALEACKTRRVKCQPQPIHRILLALSSRILTHSKVPYGAGFVADCQTENRP